MEPPPLHILDNNEYPESINPCNCNNCLSSSTLPYDNTTNNFIVTANPSPFIQQFTNVSNETSSSIFIPKEEQHIISNEQQIINHNNPDISSAGIIQTNYTELLKIEISGGVEIVVRKKSEIQQSRQQNNSNLTNRVERTQNRMHPYQMPTRKPDITVIPKQYYCTSAEINQQGHNNI
jgi:hypothetical protein